VLDAIPGDPSDDSRFVHVEVGGGEGALLIAEAGLVNEAARRKIALGAWAYTSDFPDAVDDSRTHGPTHGVYLLAETGLGTLGGPERQVVGFGRIGYADPKVHPVTLGWAAGLVYDQPWGVEDARVGLGVASAMLSTRYLEAREADASPVDRAEVAFEVTGSVPVTGWLRLQPNLQYIVNPGMDPTLDNSLVLGVRIEFGF
jgi:porin